MVAQKSNANQIRLVVTNLANQDWLKRTERRWWPHFVFHYTDIRNTLRILEEGCLYSRKYLEDHDRLAVSSGSSTVLAGTNTAIKDCVRLYFRPKTPTQYYAEGIYSQATLSKSRFPDAHCPVPIFFLFDSAQVLARDDCYFSDGNLGSQKAQILSMATELEQLPWQRIYHTGWFDPSKSEESDIAFRRNSEVIVLQRLDLNALRYIYCRSDAERETLLHLLPPNLQSRYQGKIVATTRSDLFYRRQTFIESVRLSSEAAYVQFSPDTQSPGPFHLQGDFETASLQRSIEAENFKLGPGYIYKFSLPLPATNYTISLFLDDHLAYANTYEETELPF
jgi:hypothetical protein